jgi:hypothetical protein
MRAQIVWFSENPADETGPDLDNITKPFLDRRAYCLAPAGEMRVFPALAGPRLGRDRPAGDQSKKRRR